MMDPRTAGNAETDQDRDMRHRVQQDRLLRQADIAAAKARTPGEWMDIFFAISHQMVRHTAEAQGGEELVKIAEHRWDEREPYHKKVRGMFETHGLPFTEAMEYEGPLIEKDVLGVRNNVSWPRGAWLEMRWPENKAETLRFEGTCAVVAIEFLLWWETLHGVGMHMDGKDAPEQSRMVDPNSPEYQRYLEGKRLGLGG